MERLMVASSYLSIFNLYGLGLTKRSESFTLVDVLKGLQFEDKGCGQCI